MAQVGRISGPLLTANLERNGIDLAFRNTLDTTQLLYLDVNNGLIGVNTATPAWEVDVAGTTQTVNLIAPISLDTPGFTISGNTISAKTGDLYLNAAEAVVMANLENGTIRISDNIISTIDSNADIDFTPNGTGTTEIINNLEVFGNIYTPGNITFEGTITLGDADTDNVTFNSDINSDIIPDVNNTYNLGTVSKRWSALYTNLVNGTTVTVDGYILQGIDLLTRHGGIIYVAQEGNDANSGDHLLDPLATISAALSKAEASGEQPFIILVAAGEYQESLPLVVPNNVSIIGQDIRNTVIMPDTSSQSEDVFHLNDKTTIANLTIKNHYYDNVNNTGYAFRFAPNSVMSERSPYIQNITVITQETSEGAGDAGRGAWIDGAELNVASPNATMLFHSCTFISPNADVINMTNGVRVEWLNSFTYYANRGLYAFNGVTGRISEDGSTVIYGAELRSIGSANVYGNYGAVADGADTLMYLIQHNFAYIGSGNKNDNNEADVIQANEVVELNNGQIHYVSTDQVGNFRVGDNFFVNLDTGDTSINIDTGTIESLSGLIINTPGGTTVIDASYITTGNIRIFDNKIISVVGDLDLVSATNTTDINNNTSVVGNLAVRDNFSFGGTLNIAGDQPGRTTANDRLVFNVEFEQNFNPHVTLTHDLGEVERFWNTAWLDKTEINGVTIDGNVVSTNVSNSSLELIANGTGKILVTDSVQIDNDLTVSVDTDLQSLLISGTLTQSGDIVFNPMGDRNQAGNYNIAGEISNGDILIEDNFITTTVSNSDLDLRASGTGDILISSNNVNALNNFAVIRDTSFNNLTITGTFALTGAYNQTGNISVTNNMTVTQNLVVAEFAQFEEILFDDNFITTTTSNANLELRANGTGEVLVPNENVRIVNNLDVENIFNGSNTTVTYQTAFDNANLTDVFITQNYITSSNLNEDLELKASGTGIIRVNNDTLIQNNLTVGTDTFLQNGNTTYEYGPELVVNGTFDTNLNGWVQAGGGSATATGGNLRINATGAARNISQEVTVEAGKTYDFEAQFRSVSNGNPFYLRIFESGVGTLVEWNETSGLVPDQLLTFSIVPQTTSIDIIFRAVDTIVEWDNVSMFEDIGFVTTFTPVQINVNGNIDQTGNTTKIGNIVQTGNTVVDGTVTVSNEFTKTNINIDANVIQNTGEGLRIAIETNDPNSIPRIVQAIVGGAVADDYPNQTEKNLINFLNNNDYVDVNRSGNNTTSDYLAYLQYIANGTSGDTVIDALIEQVFREIIALEYATPGYFNSILFNGDYYNPNLELRAAGTGDVLFSNADVKVTNNLTTTDVTANNIVINQDLNLNEIVVQGNIIEIDDNFISTTISNENLELRAEGNLILIPSADTVIDQNLDVLGNSNLKRILVNGNVIHTGTRNQLGNLNVIGNVTVSSTNIESDIQFENILFNNNYIETTDSNSDLELRANGTGIISFLETNVYINNNLSVGTLNSNNINISGNFDFEEANLSSDIKIFDNVITTTNSNSNLELRTVNSNNIVIESLLFNNNTISTSASDINLLVNDNFIVNSTKALQIPKGTNAERQLIDNSIRFSTSNNVFEGFKNNRVISFGGVYSSNRLTSVLAHPTNDIVTFTTNSANVGNVSSTGLVTNGLIIDDISIQGRTIETTQSNSDLELRANGTGKLVLNDVTLNNDTFTNTSDGSLIIGNTLYGKTKFTGSAVKIPAGTNAERPVSPEVGTTRWNTEEEILEVWDGSTFVTAAGTAATISREEMDELILEYTLIFG